MFYTFFLFLFAIHRCSKCSHIAVGLPRKSGIWKGFCFFSLLILVYKKTRGNSEKEWNRQRGWGVVKETEAVITLTRDRVTQGIKQQLEASSSGQNRAKRSEGETKAPTASTYALDHLFLNVGRNQNHLEVF